MAISTTLFQTPSWIGWCIQQHTSSLTPNNRKAYKPAHRWGWFTDELRSKRNQQAQVFMGRRILFCRSRLRLKPCNFLPMAISVLAIWTKKFSLGILRAASYYWIRPENLHMSAYYYANTKRLGTCSPLGNYEKLSITLQNSAGRVMVAFAFNVDTTAGHAMRGSGLGLRPT